MVGAACAVLAPRAVRDQVIRQGQYCEFLTVARKKWIYVQIISGLNWIRR